MVRSARSIAGQTFASLAYRDFRFLWAGTLLLHLGEWMEIAALLWYAQELTGSPFLVSVLFSLRLLPMAFFSFLGGVVADRVSRRNLLIATNLSGAAISIVLAVFVVSGIASLWQLIVLSLLAGTVMSFYLPGRQSILPSVVPRERLMNAISLDSGTMMASRVGGGPLVGVLLVYGGAAAVFELRAVLALAAAVLLLFIAPYKPNEKRQTSPWQDMKDALSYLRGQPTILWLVLLNMVTMLTTLSVMSLLPAFTREELHSGEWEYGLLQMGPGIGAGLSVLALATVNSIRSKGLLLFLVLIVEGAALAGFASVTWFWFSFSFMAVVGGMNNAFRTLDATLVQGVIPDSVRGRVMSLREVVTGLAPVATLLGGALAERLGAAAGLLAVGAVVALAALALMFGLPQVRRLQ